MFGSNRTGVRAKGEVPRRMLGAVAVPYLLHAREISCRGRVSLRKAYHTTSFHGFCGCNHAQMHLGSQLHGCGVV